MELRNVVHRDLAARNVLVVDDGRTVKLSDFGMSRFLSSDYYRLESGNRNSLKKICELLLARKSYAVTKGGLGRLAAWHFPDWPVGPPARWAATSNVEAGSGTEEGTQSPLAGEG